MSLHRHRHAICRLQADKLGVTHDPERSRIRCRTSRTQGREACSSSVSPARRSESRTCKQADQRAQASSAEQHASWTLPGTHKDCCKSTYQSQVCGEGGGGGGFGDVLMGYEACKWNVQHYDDRTYGAHSKRRIVTVEDSRAGGVVNAPSWRSRRCLFPCAHSTRVQYMAPMQPSVRATTDARYTSILDASLGLSKQGLRTFLVGDVLLEPEVALLAPRGAPAVLHDPIRHAVLLQSNK